MEKERIDKINPEESEKSSNQHVILADKEVQQIDKYWSDSDLERKWKSLDSRLVFLSGKNRLLAERAKKELQDKILVDLGRVEKTFGNIPQGEDIFNLINVADFDLIERAIASGSCFWDYYYNLEEGELKQRLDIVRKFDEFTTRVCDEFKITELAGRNILKAFIIKKHIDKTNALEFEETKAKSVEEDEKKIQKLRQYFDPEEELLEINKADRSEKKVKLKIFKENLAEYKLGNAIVNAELERMILADNILDEYAIINFIEESAKKYKWSPTQIARYGYFLFEIQKINKNINYFAEKYKNKDNAVFFQDLFGFAPVGKIEIERSSISFCVVCKDFEDYVNICGGDVRKANLSGGLAGGKVLIPELSGVVTFIKDTFVDDLPAKEREEKLRQIRIHEDKHIINEVVRNAETAASFKYLKKGDGQITKAKNENQNDYLNSTRFRNEERAKDEILAYIKDGEYDVATIERILLEKKTEGGLYDYFSVNNLSSSFPQFEDPEDQLVFQNKLEKNKIKYEENVKKALESVELLRLLGFLRGETLGLLQTEKLTNWSKLLRRTISNPEVRKKADGLIVKIDGIVENIKSNIAHEESQLAKNKKKSIVNYYKTFDAFLYNKLIFNNRFIPRPFKHKHAMINPDDVANWANSNLKYWEKELKIKLAQREKILNL